MQSTLIYQIAADAMLVMHALFIAFVVLGLLSILIGKLAGWRWVFNLRFRLAHLVAIAIVVLQSWFGILCPLTVWEMQLRAAAGEQVYGESFIAHWLHRLLFYQAPEWVFTLTYTGFAALVALSWYWVRPRR